MGAVDPQGVANLDPTGKVCMIYVGDHLTLLHTKSISSGPHGFKEEDFEGSFAIYLYIIFLLFNGKVTKVSAYASSLYSDTIPTYRYRNDIGISRFFLCP